MRKTTPIILTMILLMSAFASIGWSELDETKTSNDTDARAGPDGQLTDITEPRASQPADSFGPAVNEIFAGDEVQFELFIKNVGTADIKKMGISVTVYEDPDGQPGGTVGPIASDSNGAALVWTNSDVICDDVFACPQTTLAPQAVLDGGAYLLVVQGSVVTWTPTVGTYQVKVELDVEGASGVVDAEPDNNEMVQFVAVVDWTDVIVDLEWFSGKNVEGGADDKDFTLTVTTAGSISWQARNVEIQLGVSGAVSDAKYWTDLDGDNQTHGGDHHGGESAQEQENSLLYDGTVYRFDEIGTNENVLTYEAGDDRTNNQSDDRWNMRMGDQWTLNGTVTPNGGVTEGTYQIEVLMVNYTIYGIYSPECDRESNQTDDNGDAMNTTLTVTDSCEVNKLQDDDVSTSEDMIEGDISNYHDMSITSLIINQRYPSDTLDANGFPSGVSEDPGLLDGPLEPGLATVQARVSHNGNNPAALNNDQQYVWNITFEITDRSTGVTTSQVANECFNGEMAGGLGYSDVGGTGPSEGDACVAYVFTPGAYDLAATVDFTHRGVVKDQNSFNDVKRLNSVLVLNNRPTVTLTLGTTGAIIIGDETIITLEADASDIEDPTGSSLVYNWTYPGMVVDPSGQFAGEFDGVGKTFSSATMQVVGDLWIGYQTVSVTVSDGFTTASDTVSFTVWNRIVADSTSASGVSMVYDLTYSSASVFSINLTDSTSGYTGQSLDGYSGTYDSVAVLDYVPSTFYDATFVLDQIISITYDSANFNPTSVWYVDTNGVWTELSASDDVTGTVGTINIILGANAPTIAEGQIVLMGGELVLAEPPTAHPMGFIMAASKGGSIGMSWAYQGSYTDSDRVVIELCENAPGCADPTNVQGLSITQTAATLSGQGSTIHGTTYFATISVCNDAGCNAVVGIANATADAEVDNHPTATAITVANGDSVWALSWTATGNTSDVANWMVCYGDSSWSAAGDMPGDCVNAAAGATSADVPMSTAPGTKKFYFAVVPMDLKGNYDTAISTADIDYVGVSEDPGQGTGTDVGSTTDVDGAVPSWTWGVIIGIVVVAFIAGAFILSRGGEDGEGKDWDY